MSWIIEKGWENCRSGIKRDFQKYLEEMHLAYDSNSSKYFQGFLNKSLVKVAP